MNDMKLVVAGAGGRMGQALIKAICETDHAALHAAFEREGSPLIGQDAGAPSNMETGIIIGDDPLVAIARADGLIDFTTPETSALLAGYAAQARITHVIGTTGCRPEDEARIEAAARHATIIKSGNMSLGVNLLSVLVRQAARALDAADFDIEVLEMHHKHKVDAPSGTALLLGEAAAQGREIALGENSVRVRDGHTGPRESGTIGFATLRGGSVVGDHSVILAGPGETITLSHHAGDRLIFARGAVRAALWGFGRKPGLYSMLDVLGLSDHQPNNN